MVTIQLVPFKSVPAIADTSGKGVFTGQKKRGEPMTKSIHYVIDNSRVSESKADVRQALKQGAIILKVTRPEYHTGPTRVTVFTATEITKSKDV